MYVASALLYPPRLGSTLLLALAEGEAAGVAGLDEGTGGRLVRVDRKDRGGAAVAAMAVERYDELLNLPHSHSPVEPLYFFIDGGSCHDRVPGHACMSGCGALVALG